MTKVEPSKLVPIYCIIPSTWNLPEILNYETTHEFLRDCSESQREGVLKVKLEREGEEVISCQ